MLIIFPQIFCGEFKAKLVQINANKITNNNIFNVTFQDWNQIAEKFVQILPKTIEFEVINGPVFKGEIGKFEDIGTFSNQCPSVSKTLDAGEIGFYCETQPDRYMITIYPAQTPQPIKAHTLGFIDNYWPFFLLMTTNSGGIFPITGSLYFYTEIISSIDDSFELRIILCIDEENPNLGIYLNKKFYDLNTEDKCLWRHNIEKINDNLKFKTILYKTYDSKSIPIVRNFTISKLELGETIDDCIYKKENSQFILECNFNNTFEGNDAFAP